MAPMMLVATKVIANNMTEVSAVPKIPVKIAVNAALPHRQQPDARQHLEVANSTTKYTMAVPSATHKNAGVTVITAVICKRAATTPRIALAITAKVTQLGLFSQQKIDINFSPPLSIL